MVKSRDSGVSLATCVLIPAPSFYSSMDLDNLFNCFVVVVVSFRFFIYKMEGWIILVYHPLMVNLMYQWMDSVVYLLLRFVARIKGTQWYRVWHTVI